ncbi:DUF1311 domain-containing protein [Paraburkholderia sp. JPY432]|nr:DUF1311 domain-containing protein [Paraburkholderia youngii]
MMRSTSMFFLLLCMSQATYCSQSIYGSEFDYKKAKPTSDYFYGKSRKEIELYCKREMLGTSDLSACAQFRYERIMDAFDKRVSEVEKILEEDDKANGAYGQPAALPYFKKAQANWLLYRENDCYSNVYSVGQASLRFVDFWDCMTGITKHRLDELTKPNSDD